MGNLGDILSKKIKSLGIERQVEAADVCERAIEEIAKFIPREDFEVVSFNRETLTVSVKASAVATELRLNQKKIAKELTTKNPL